MRLWCDCQSTNGFAILAFPFSPIIPIPYTKLQAKSNKAGAGKLPTLFQDLCHLCAKTPQKQGTRVVLYFDAPAAQNNPLAH